MQTAPSSPFEPPPPTNLDRRRSYFAMALSLVLVIVWTSVLLIFPCDGQLQTVAVSSLTAIAGGWLGAVTPSSPTKR